MRRLTRINTIWRKELSDTLRDRRTLIAMIFMPMVLYPAMMLFSLQGFEYQVSRLKQEEYRVGVTSESARAWLRRIVDEDPARHPEAAGRTAEELLELAERGELTEAKEEGAPKRKRNAAEAAQADVRANPPAYTLIIVPDPDLVRRKVDDGSLHVGLVASGELPRVDGGGSAKFTLVLNQTDIRSQIASAGLEGVLQRASQQILTQRLARASLAPSFVRPIEIEAQSVATPEEVGGSIIGQIVPLILVVMTIIGAIYPAIDLTAGERERGTLETLMVAPVPTVDLIAGKFVVVTLIAMLSAALNLLSIGGTIYLGGLGQLLTQGGAVVIPLSALPWVLLVLVPLAVMFGAALLAVCSFARSFKEAQNYVMPVTVAALIPAVVGVLPGTRLDGPLLIMPVANIVVLTRDLFMGKFDLFNVLWVLLSSTLYAGAAVAVAAKLFGQEAVLFADSGSVKTLFKRRFFKPADRPTAAQAALLLALLFSANVFLQQRFLGSPSILGTMKFWWGFAAILISVFVLAPAVTALYMRVRVATAFGLQWPDLRGFLPALCFGASTWILAQALFVWQQSWLPLPPEVERLFESMTRQLDEKPAWMTVLFLAVLPALCEEFFFRGYALNGLRGALGKIGAVIVVAGAFGVYHHSVHRLIPTTLLGILFGVLAVRYRTIWPAMLAHLLHNGLGALSMRADALRPVLERGGYVPGQYPPAAWLAGAALLVTLGLLMCWLWPRAGQAPTTAATGIAVVPVVGPPRPLAREPATSESTAEQ